MSGSAADGTDVVVRLAGPADAAEITRLRAVMLASVDGGPLRLDEEWADLCRSELASRLAAGTVLVAMGVLVLTGELFRLNIEAQQLLSKFGLNFFQSI